MEIAFPLAKLVENTIASLPIIPGRAFWRINFSRVQWAVSVSANGTYLKEPSCQVAPDSLILFAFLNVSFVPNPI